MELGLKSKWYIVYTYPNLEKKIYNDLTRRSIKAYLPLQHVVRQWSDRKKVLEVPMFPNYLFINSKERERFNLLKVSGILKIIMFDGKAAVVTDEEIETIRKFEQLEFELEPLLVRGDEVLIIDGPFTGLKGKLFSKKGRHRLGVCIQSISQSLSVDVNSSSIRKLSDQISYN